MAKPRGLRHRGLVETERRQRGATGNGELRPHQIDRQHFLGHGVLDLQPRIGLDEGEGALALAGFAIDQKFERAEVVILRLRRKIFGGFDDAAAQLVVTATDSGATSTSF